MYSGHEYYVDVCLFMRVGMEFLFCIYTQTFYGIFQALFLVPCNSWVVCAGESVTGALVIPEGDLVFCAETSSGVMCRNKFWCFVQRQVCM